MDYNVCQCLCDILAFLQPGHNSLLGAAPALDSCYRQRDRRLANPAVADTHRVTAGTKTTGCTDGSTDTSPQRCP